jgi:hypothetical protein
MKALLRRSLVFALLTQCSGIGLGAETTEDKSSSRSTTLNSLLKSEAEGQAVDRSLVLRSPPQDSSSNDGKANVGKDNVGKDRALHWQAGELEINGQWQKLSELDKSRLPKLMQRYLEERGDAPLDKEGHRRLAKWCLANPLPDQEKAHWYGVLESDPNDLEARRALKFTQIEGRWFSPEEIASTQTNAKQQAKAIKSWLPKIRDIVAGIENNDTQKRLKAIQQLKAIKDPNAVRALQFAAERSQNQTALHLLNAIQRFQTKDACMALAAIAVNSPTTELGQEAATALSKYPKEMYVPALLDLMSTEKDLRRNLVIQPNGDLVLQLLEVRELKSHVQTAQLDKVLKINNSNTVPFGMNLPFASRGAGGQIFSDGNSVTAASENQVAAAVTQNEAQRDADAQQARLAKENEVTRQLQRSVCTVLRSTTGQKLDDTPTEWWNWWDLEQEVLTIGNKEILRNYDRNFQSLVYSVEPQRVRMFRVSGSTEEDADPQPAPTTPRTDRTNLIRPNLARVNPNYRIDCLTAGSKIQTDLGLRPVETIQIGDNVVSQNIETGEISLKPVIRTSQRPPSITCTIVLVNEEKIQGTLGHHWWVIGKGWTKTKDLLAGMHIRTASGSIEIAKLEDAEEAPTYNISVADHHSYFVGEARLLSFDSRELVPTFQLVPGVPPSALFNE